MGLFVLDIVLFQIATLTDSNGFLSNSTSIFNKTFQICCLVSVSNQKHHGSFFLLLVEYSLPTSLNKKFPQPPCFVISNFSLNLQPKISASLFCSCCVECFFYSTPKQNLVSHYTFFSFVCYNLISVSLRSRSLLHTPLCYHTLVTTPNPKQKKLFAALLGSLQ